MRLPSAIPHFCGNSWNFAPVSKNICIHLVSWIAPITMIAHSVVCINLLSFLPQFSTLTLSIRFCAFCGRLRDAMPEDFPASFPICMRGEIQCCSFSVYKLSYLYGTSSMRQRKRFLFTFDVNTEITCDQASQRKWGNLLKDRLISG